MAFVSAHLERLCRFNSAESSDFLDLYDAATETAIRNEREKKPGTWISPSSMRCLRKTWFKLRGMDPDVRENVDSTLEWLANIGTAAHEIIQSRLSAYLGDNWISAKRYIEDNLDNIPWTRDEYGKTNYSVDYKGYETRVCILNPYVKFSVDGLVKFENEVWLLEIKTMETASFRDIVEPREKDQEQIRTYASLLGIHKVFILYVDRTYGDTKCFKYIVPEYVFKEIWDKISYVQNAANFGLAPDRLPKGDIWCSECIYKKTCDQWG